jgi:hypothetical protein
MGRTLYQRSVVDSLTYVLSPRQVPGGTQEGGGKQNLESRAEEIARWVRTLTLILSLFQVKPPCPGPICISSACFRSRSGILNRAREMRAEHGPSP